MWALSPPGHGLHPGLKGNRDDVLPPVVTEIHDLLCFSFSFGPSLPVSGSAYPLLHLSAWSASLASPTSGLLCPLLTSGFPARSPEVSSAAFRAQSPDLRSACLMDMDFAVRGTLVPRSRLVSGFCSSTRAFAPRFFQTPLTAVALALR